MNLKSEEKRKNWSTALVLACLRSDKLSLSPDPGKHALEGRILIKPIAFAAVSSSEIVNHGFIADVAEFLQSTLSVL